MQNSTNYQPRMIGIVVLATLVLFASAWSMRGRDRVASPDMMVSPQAPVRPMDPRTRTTKRHAHARQHVGPQARVPPHATAQGALDRSAWRPAAMEAQAETDYLENHERAEAELERHGHEARQRLVDRQITRLEGLLATANAQRNEQRAALFRARLRFLRSEIAE